MLSSRRFLASLAFSLGIGLSGPPLGLAQTPSVGPAPPTVFLDIVVSDAKGRPITDLAEGEIVVSQEGAHQAVATFTAKAPGRYELSYAPISGKPAAVSVRLLRAGTRVTGPNGGALTPRVVVPASPLEQELTRILEARPEADDFLAQASAFRFEPASVGQHYTLAVEIPFSSLTPSAQGGQQLARAQLLVRLKDEAGAVVQRSSMERALSAASPALFLAQRLVWTTQVRLKPGRYVLEALARDAGTDRAAARHVPFTVPPTSTAGLGISSVALLQPAGNLIVRDRAKEADDPFMLQGEPLMPTLGLRTPAAAGVKVEFFAIVYPDRTSTEPVTLRLDLVRDGNIVGSAPVALPAADERGEIRYAGAMPIRTLHPAEYRLRLHAQQGSSTTEEEAPFVVLEASGEAPLRLSDRNPPADRKSASLVAKAPPLNADLADAERLLRVHRFEDALAKLKKLDEATGGTRADVRVMLALAYYREGAYKDAETIALRAVDTIKDDPPALIDAYFLLGRIQAASEKSSTRKDSERLAAAEASFRKVIDLSHGESEAGRLALAETMYRLGRGDEARATLSALAEKPSIRDDTAARVRQLQRSPRCATEPCLPDMAFITSDGRRLTQDDLRGKVVLLSFWATWCGPCVAATPDLKRLHAKFEKEPFAMIGVNLDRDRETMQSFATANDMRWPQITENTDRISEAVGRRGGIPAEILFDHEGVFITQSVGWDERRSTTLASVINRALGKAKAAPAPAPAP
jgi:thiol-disulfide isomerase/thioredoxin